MISVLASIFTLALFMKNKPTVNIEAYFLKKNNEKQSYVSQYKSCRGEVGTTYSVADTVKENL